MVDKEIPWYMQQDLSIQGYHSRAGAGEEELGTAWQIIIKLERNPGGIQQGLKYWAEGDHSQHRGGLDTVDSLTPS